MVQNKLKKGANNKSKTRPIITLTTDFGADDPFVGIMKGVILSIAPMAEVVDIMHQVNPHDIAHASHVIGSSYSWFPKGTIHVVVCDPGVGSKRRPLVAEYNGHKFVAPDNGVLTTIFKPGFRSWELTQSKYFLKPVSATFHGRDVFAPCAGWLALGTRVSDMGRSVPKPLVLDLPQPTFKNKILTGQIVFKDRFGNLTSNIPAELLKDCFPDMADLKIKLGKKTIITGIASYYSQIQKGKVGGIINSWNNLEIFCREGSAATATRCDIGETVAIKKP
jgi:S-adenosylmethionine hydrolase